MLGEDHPDVLAMMNNLLAVHRKVGETIGGAGARPSTDRQQ
jgi:hypothetical protein